MGNTVNPAASDIPKDVIHAFVMPSRIVDHSKI
jgi:hypothetical protein